MNNNLNENIFFNYISQIYISLVGIIFVLILVSKMGAEAYGLIGFYSTLMSVNYFLIIKTSNRLILFLFITGYSLLGLLVAVLCSHYARTFILSITKKRLLGKL